MFPHILQRMQEKIRTLDYVLTLHAEEEMEDDELSILDVEQAFLTGEIIERQRAGYCGMEISDCRGHSGQ